MTVRAVHSLSTACTVQSWLPSKAAAGAACRHLGCRPSDKLLTALGPFVARHSTQLTSAQAADLSHLLSEFQHDPGMRLQCLWCILHETSQGLLQLRGGLPAELACTHCITFAAARLAHSVGKSIHWVRTQVTWCCRCCGNSRCLLFGSKSFCTGWGPAVKCLNSFVNGVQHTFMRL